MSTKKKDYTVLKKDVKRFLSIKREASEYRPVCERVKDYKDVVVPKSADQARSQAGRCMDCGTPFCHSNCPVGNLIPEWNAAQFEGNMDKAFTLLNETNTLPEITGRVCPALCEAGCVLGVNDDAVTCRENELSIIETAFEKGYIKACPPKRRTGKKVAVVGSGPAGFAAATQLNRAGHTVTVFERDEAPGGVMRYGIPDFKLEKWVIDRRADLMKEEGVKFKCNTEVGSEKMPMEKILADFDAVCLTGGSRTPRDLPIKGRELEGIHFAMDFLMQSNRRVAGKKIAKKDEILATGKNVVVIGGGDTGSDCVGTSNRQGAGCVVQIEVMPKPPEDRTADYPWPNYPLMLKTTSSHQEGVDRDWCVLTKEFIGEEGKVKKIKCVRVEFEEAKDGGRPAMKEVPGSEFEIDADLVVLAIGFLHPEHEGMLKDLGVKLDGRGNVETGSGFKTSVDKVFAAGDMRRGQSLIVWAVSEGRKAAAEIDEFLMGKTSLPNY